MAIKELGETLDIHGGGLDLQFPHHENELAQSESWTGKPFARIWMHNGLLKMGSAKMAEFRWKRRQHRGLAETPFAGHRSLLVAQHPL